MTTRIRLLILLIMICYFAVIFFFLHRKRLEQKYSLVWLAVGVGLVLLVIWPGLLEKLAAGLGIWSPMNAFFAMGFFFILLICFSMSIILSRLRRNVQKLAQTCALYEKRIREMETQIITQGKAEPAHDE